MDTKKNTLFRDIKLRNFTKFSIALVQFRFGFLYKIRESIRTAHNRNKIKIGKKISLEL